MKVRQSREGPLAASEQRGRIHRGGLGAFLKKEGEDGASCPGGLWDSTAGDREAEVMAKDTA